MRNKKNKKTKETKKIQQTERMIAMEEIFSEEEILEMEKLLEAEKNDQDEFLLKIGKIYEQEMAKLSNDDFVVNPPQMEKFAQVLSFFIDLSEQFSGQIEPIFIEPKHESAGVTATFPVVDIYGNNKERFLKIISYVSAITMDATDDGVCISVTVPEVFVPKTEQSDCYLDSITD